MARLCERPGCSQPAEVIYGISAEQLMVWIESLDQAVAYRAGVLCRRHADSMVVPLGWMLDDRREAVPRLFKQREAPPAVASPPRRRRTRGHRDDTGQLALSTVSDEPSVDAEALPAAAPAAGVVGTDTSAPWKPVFDQSDDLGGLLQARSPLLSRAFGKRDRPSEP
jgi:hypothetical protein